MYSIFDLGCSLLDAQLHTGSLQIKNNSIFSESIKGVHLRDSGTFLQSTYNLYNLCLRTFIFNKLYKRISLDLLIRSTS